MQQNSRPHFVQKPLEIADSDWSQEHVDKL
jgi:hypothetical protein